QAVGVNELLVSPESLVAAGGPGPRVEVLVAANVGAVVIMMVAAGAIGRFVDTDPTIKMLALSFLMMVGIALMGEALKFHIPEGYIYFAMAFSVVVEMLNIRLRRKISQPVQLRKSGPAP